MSTPKITHVQRTCDHSFRWRLLFADGDGWSLREDTQVHERLAARGQRLDIPPDAPPGWVGVPEDIPTPTPLPEGWSNIYRGSSGYATRAEADAWAMGDRPFDDSRRVAVLHVWTDEHGVDHAEIERVTP